MAPSRRIARIAALTAFAVAGAGAALPAPAFAAPRCRMERADALPFPSYDPFSATATDQIVTMSYSCTNTPGPTITLDAGQNFSAGSRAMVASGGGSRLKYEVYLDAARTAPFTPAWMYDATAAIKQTITLYARIPPGQWVPAGRYTDQLVITILF